MMHTSRFPKADAYDWFCAPGFIYKHSHLHWNRFPREGLFNTDCFTSWCKRPSRFAWFETACWETSCCVRGTSLHCERTCRGSRSCPPCGCSKARFQRAPERLTSRQTTFDGKTYPWWTPERQNRFFLWISDMIIQLISIHHLRFSKLGVGETYISLTFLLIIFLDSTLATSHEAQYALYINKTQENKFLEVGCCVFLPS